MIGPVFRFACALLVSAVVAACSSAASSADAGGLHDSAPCPGVSGYTCSTLAVPLDHAGHAPGTLNLAVAAADNSDAPKGVLLLIAGGPGQAAVPLLQRIPAIVGAELQAYRIVVYDQRGTGAGALDCGALQEAMGTSDLTPPTPASVAACARKLGARRQFFGTDDVVADMESLREALGIQAWTLDGISYGTFVGERYALAHPDRVKRLVLDSVVPHVGESDLGVDEFHATARVLGDICGARCVADLAAVVKARHNGPQLLDALTLLSIIDPTYRRIFDVPALLAGARRGRLSQLRSLLDAARTASAARPRCSTKGCMRVRSVPTGVTRGARPRRHWQVVRSRSVAQWRSSHRGSSTRSTAPRRAGTASSGSASPGRRRRRRRSSRRRCACRHFSSTAIATCRRRSSGRARSWR
jgi:pimeloyl-ACP methyl ester carboxylesterase